MVSAATAPWDLLVLHPDMARFSQEEEEELGFGIIATDEDSPSSDLGFTGSGGDLVFDGLIFEETSWIRCSAGPGPQISRSDL